MKKSKIASMNSDLARTPKEAMAPKEIAPEKSDSDREREGEIDLDDLLRAEKIKLDPDRMKYVLKAHEKKSTAMRSIEDLKMASQALAHAESEMMKEKPAQPRHKNRYPKREA